MNILNVKFDNLTIAQAVEQAIAMFN